MERIYIAIDLKSFYASVECVQRGLDPLDTNLVVADSSRTEKTICLAVSPSLKSFGIPGRPRLFEVIQKVELANSKRKKRNDLKEFEGKSYIYSELSENPALEIDYVIAPPRMALYTKYSVDIYKIYLKYIAPEDIHVYSIDEVFIDATGYLNLYKMSAQELALKIISDVFDETGITATVGIGTNMYLCKIAMDIMAKKMQPDKNGARIAYLDEMSYRREFWEHRPLTDFWRVGRGYSKKLEDNGIYTMGDIARYSLTQFGEDKLYKLFGVNAELLIDHAWGWEPCTMADIKAYKPMNNSSGMGQVLHCPYNYEQTKLVIKEMAEMTALDLVEKNLVTDQIILTVGYDIENLTNPKIRYKGEVTKDNYGRRIPKHAHGTANLGKHTASAKLIRNATLKLFDEIIDRNLLARRINLTANHVIAECDVKEEKSYVQLDLFTDYEKAEKEDRKSKAELAKEKSMQKTMVAIKKKYGKNAILRGINLEEDATAISRNGQIGGHKA